MSSKFIADTLKEINAFRAKPIVIKKSCQAHQTEISRVKGNEKYAREVKEFIDNLESIDKTNALVLNKTLSKIADAQVVKYAGNPDKYTPFLFDKKMKGIIPKAFESEEPCLVGDSQAESPPFVVINMLLNIKDTEQIGRNALTNGDYTQIGIGHIEVDEDNYIVCIFANNDVQNEEEEDDYAQAPKADLTELKQAFDLFDHDKSGRIKMSEAIEAMKRMKFDKSDPTLYAILSDLSKNEYVNWAKFAGHISMRLNDRETNDGLKTIFNIFINEPEQKTITFETFKRILREIDVSISDDELRHILENTTERGIEISFNDFCEYMGEK